MNRKLLFPIIMVALMVVSVFAYAAQANSKSEKISDEHCFTTMCHKGKTITIKCNAVGAHMSHGDGWGACN